MYAQCVTRYERCIIRDYLYTSRFPQDAGICRVSQATNAKLVYIIKGGRTRDTRNKAISSIVDCNLLISGYHCYPRAWHEERFAYPYVLGKINKCLSHLELIVQIVLSLNHPHLSIMIASQSRFTSIRIKLSTILIESTHRYRQNWEFK